MISNESRGRAEDGRFGVLRPVGLIAALAGAVGSMGFMLHASQHPPRILLVLFVIWVLAPFVALVLAAVVSNRWLVQMRGTLYRLMLVVSLGSLAIYGENALRPLTAKAAPVFVAVPAASWLIIAVAIGIAAPMSRRRSPRNETA